MIADVMTACYLIFIIILTVMLCCKWSH